jgi:hypothetical protein
LLQALYVPPLAAVAPGSAAFPPNVVAVPAPLPPPPPATAKRWPAPNSALAAPPPPLDEPAPYAPPPPTPAHTFDTTPAMRSTREKAAPFPPTLAVL